MKTNIINIKELLKGIGIIFSYLFVGVILNISFSFIKNEKISFFLLYFGLALIFGIIYLKDLKNDFKSFKNNYKSILKTTFIYWLIGLIIMIISSNIIKFIGISEIVNQSENIDYFKKMPIVYSIVVITLVPLIEELVFRRSLKYSSSNKHIYAFISGFIFALLHITSSLTNFNNLILLLYLIPYGAVSIAFGYSYKKTNNIYGTIIIHSIHNLISLIEVIILGGLI